MKNIKNINNLKLLIKQFFRKWIINHIKLYKKWKIYSRTRNKKENSEAEYFYILFKGSVTREGKRLRDLEKGSFFWSISLLSENKKRSASVVVVSNSTCNLIPKQYSKILLNN